MKSIERRYRISQSKNPNFGDYINLAKTVKGQNYSKGTISKWFPELVNSEEYDKADKIRLINNLWTISNIAEEHENKPFFAPQTTEANTDDKTHD